MSNPANTMTPERKAQCDAMWKFGFLSQYAASEEKTPAQIRPLAESGIKQAALRYDTLQGIRQHILASLAA